MKDKTFDERYYILTLMRVARELEDRMNRGIYRPVPVLPVEEAEEALPVPADQRQLRRQGLREPGFRTVQAGICLKGSGTILIRYQTVPAALSMQTAPPRTDMQ